MGACGPRPCYGRGRTSQARRDSNPQPPVLETGALPVELRTSVSVASLGAARGPAGAWPGTESNRRHRDFQSRALPTELPGQKNPPGAGAAGGGSSEALPDALPPTASRPTRRARPRISHRPPAGLERIRREDAARATRLKRVRHADRRPGVDRGKGRPAADPARSTWRSAAGGDASRK